MLSDLLVKAIVLPFAVAEKGVFKSVCFASASPGGTRFIAVAATIEDFQKFGWSQRFTHWYTEWK